MNAFLSLDFRKCVYVVAFKDLKGSADQCLFAKQMVIALLYLVTSRIPFSVMLKTKMCLQNMTDCGWT